MHIKDHKLITDSGDMVELPCLSVESVVRVWDVPVGYRPSGIFVSVTSAGMPMEIPACDHGNPVFEQILPASNEAVLAEAKAKKNAEINEWRLAANQSTFEYQGKRFARDILSRSELDGVANTIKLKGTFPTGFTNSWKAIDNTYVPLPTIDDFGDFYQAMSDQGAANFAHAQRLKSELANATTVEEVESITCPLMYEQSSGSYDALAGLNTMLSINSG